MRQTLFLARACWTVTEPAGIKLTFLTNKERGGGGKISFTHQSSQNVVICFMTQYSEDLIRKLSLGSSPYPFRAQ